MKVNNFHGLPYEIDHMIEQFSITLKLANGVLHHDNVSCHTLLIRELLNMTVRLHPSYSPD